ncbi:MAG: lipoprotein insertase outer membrane protein LolB [Nitrosomonas sp.]|nr:lipoprotein insertase outer membrane protein LolB [Nitrosomonas sp.]
MSRQISVFLSGPSYGRRMPLTDYHSVTAKIGLLVMIPVFLFVAGCAAFAPPMAATAVRTLVIEPVTDLPDAPAADFNVIGRVSVQNAQHSFSGNVHWQHTQPEDIILLLSPFGQAVAEIRKNDDVVSLVTAKEEAFYARDVEELTDEVLGWRLPLNGLQYWIQGMHSPASVAIIELDDEDRIVAIRQDGWQIVYVRYFADQSERTVVRPRIIELQFDALKIRIVVDNWI